MVNTCKVRCEHSINMSYHYCFHPLLPPMILFLSVLHKAFIDDPMQKCTVPSLTYAALNIVNIHGIIRAVMVVYDRNLICTS